ncbi:MAG: hypothetical protein QOJ98_3042 [Acidobacteriota bacterium]|jgi:hypothetical protein|nr:hypothetical protein [Acidobacteriota bacterium]
MYRSKWLLAAVLVAAPLLAQEPISDNSFFIEEAYNQEPGVVQHIGTFARMRGGDWAASFTQEWPLFSQEHQLSYTVPFADSELGDVALNYRYQLLGVGGGPVAFAPRISLLLPTSDGSETAWQVNLPLSVGLNDRFVTHSNAGATFTGSERTVTLGQSLVWLAAPRVNLLVEAVWDDDDNFIVSPGIRWAHNLDSGLQIVPGIAMPIGVGPSSGERGVFLYLSFEHAY